MGLRINTNTDALDAYRNLSMTQSKMSDSLQKLSSGYRINKAADDAAGLSISQGLQSQIGGLTQAVKNAQDGINVVQTADGALTEVDSILQRMNSLAVQAANTGSQDTTARQAAQTELTQLNADLDNIGSTTSFGNSKLLNGSFGNSAATLAAGATVGGTGVVTSSTVANHQFSIAGNFEKADGSTASLAATAVTVGPAGGTTYATASAYQAALQQGLDSTMTTAGFAAGTVQATVSDAGNGVWKVSLSSDKALTSTGAGTQASPYVYTGSTFTVSAVGSDLTGKGVAAGTSSTTGTGGGVFQIGANAGEAQTVSIGAISASALGTSGLDLVNNASSAITAIQTAITNVSTERANLGAYQNGFQHTINNLNVTVENLQSSNSSIQDTDMASEMVNFTKEQVLQQAGVSMLAQANSASQSVLKLLG
jgi:flagellin